MARIVIVGAGGFVGSHLTDRHLADGDSVVGVDNFLTGTRANLAHLDGEPRFDLVEHDITTPLSIAGAVDGIYHLASPASPVDYFRFPLETLAAGSTGTGNVLDFAREKQCRMLFASTSEVYGDPLVSPQPESYWGNVNPIGPRSAYDEAKRFGEALTVAHTRVHGTDTAIVRIFNVYGARMRPDDGRVIPAFVGQALDSADVTVQGDGTQTRSFCFVTDEVDGLVRLFRSGHPGPMNIGNDDEISMLDLAHKIIELTGSSSRVVHVEGREEDPQRRVPDARLAVAELGWRPRIEFTDGLRATIDYFRALGATADDPASDR